MKRAFCKLTVDIDEERSRLVMDSLYTSYAASASACTVIAPLLTTDFGSISKLKDFWELLAASSMFARVIWECHARTILG
jgi:hypothetical protein